MKNFFEKLKKVKSFDDLKKLYKTDRNSVNKLVLSLLVCVIIYGLWTNGQDKEIMEAEPQADILSAEDTAQYGASDSVIYVDICGEVRCPGVYEVEEGARLFNVIELAGGITQDASIDNLNRAEAVYDGQKIYIPSVDEVENDAGTSFSYDSSTNNQINAKDSQGRININYADSTTLQEIPGIGPVKADAIVSYREENGRFNSIDEITNVSGIGSKTLENIKSYITT